MKNNNRSTTLKGLITATAALGFITIPIAVAQVERSGSDTELERSGLNTEQDRYGLKTDRTPLKTEVTETFVDGYTVPAQYRAYFKEFPNIDQENVVVRYHKGRAYYVNSNDWKIVRVVELDNSIQMEDEDAVLVEGKVIPEDRRTRFIDVPKPEGTQQVRYHNNTAYYMDSDFKIVRTVRLER